MPEIHNRSDLPKNESAATEDSSTNTAAATSDAQAQDFKNLKGEFNRKISQMSQKLDAKLDAVLNAFSTRNNNVSTQSVDETPAVDTDVKQYVDSVVTQQKQKDAWNEALEMFPELNPESEDFDEKFYKTVDAEFSTNQRRDPRGPLKAAKLAALELGKIEQLTRQSLLKDEARRSRIISEGSSTSREGKKEKETFNLSDLQRQSLAKLGVNPEKLAKRIKDNKEKYGV